jgi:hypothetical protein
MEWVQVHAERESMCVCVCGGGAEMGGNTAWIWWYCDPSKHQELLAQQYNIPDDFDLQQNCCDSARPCKVLFFIDSHKLLQTTLTSESSYMRNGRQFLCRSKHILQICTEL